MAKPRNPAACWRPAGSCRRTRPQMPQPEGGQRDHRRTEDQPRSCFRVGLRCASARRQSRPARWATARRPIRSARAGTCRSTAPTGRAASNHELAAITTAMPSSASAMPSRRWPGSRSRARPTERAVDPAPLASISQPARTPAPDGRCLRTRSPTGCGVAAGLRRGAEGRAGRDPPREPAFDLLERAPDRRGGLTGHGCKPSRTSPIFTICHTGHRKVSIVPASRLYGAEMTTSQAETAIPTSSKVLCAVYGVIAIAALIATWSQNAAYFDNPGGFLLDFLNDSKVTPASRSLTVDIVLFFLAAAILMVVEARKHGVRFVWAYIAGGVRDRDQRDLPAVPDRQGASRRQDRDNAVGRRRHRPPRRVRGRGGRPDDMGRHGLTDADTCVGRLGIRPARTQRGVHHPCPSLSSPP